MQPNTLTLVVDVNNTGTGQVTETYSKFEEFQNKSTYIAASHSFASRNKADLFRTFPTRSGNFKGTLKSSVKFTKDISVPGVDGVNIIAPVIAEVNFSIPVGASDAEVLALRQRIISMLDGDTVMNDLNIRLMV